MASFFNTKMISKELRYICFSNYWICGFYPSSACFFNCISYCEPFIHAYVH